jgi:hypothetical protein
MEASPSQQMQIKITNIPALFELNKPGEDKFSVRISVTAQAEFDYTVVTQKDIDDENVVYRRSKNRTAKMQVVSQGPYQPHFISLRTENDIDAELLIEPFEETPPPTEIPPGSEPYQNGEKTNQNISAVVWIVLLVLLFMMMNKRR